MSNANINNIQDMQDIQDQKIVKKKSTKIIPRKKNIINQKKKRKCHSFEKNKEHFEIKFNVTYNNIPMSESISVISGLKEDLKNKNINLNYNNYN
jgi:23S rRNA maturation-related 3'-5' exoribonuclease YhaM